MPNSQTEIISLTIISTTFFLFIVGAFAVRYVFLYQKRRFRHQQELIELREIFNQTLLQSKLDIQEQTLDHIAKELHANVGHLVSLVQIGLEELGTQTTGPAKENVLETQGLTRQLFAELKALNASLNTDHIMHIGFVKALRNELTRLGNTKKYEISFTITGQEYRLGSDDEIILFRLCQEILNNTVRYAQAKKISLALHYSPNNFILEITDDGIGFDVKEAMDPSTEKVSTGLINMQKRANLINASIDIESSPGKGARFNIKIITNTPQTATI